MSITVDARTSRSRLGRQFTRSALGLAAFALASSVLATPGAIHPRTTPATAAPTRRVQVIVVALDGARFREESARVWLVAAGSAIEARGFVAAPAARRLADIAPTLRTLFGLPADHDGNAGTPLLELLRLTERAGG